MKHRRLPFSALAVALLIAASRPTSLDAFAGRYPFEKVGGTTFLTHPRVLAASRRAAPNPMLARQAVTAEVSTPIAGQGRLLLAGSCQAHNCPGRNWTIVVDDASGAGAVCYYQRDLTDGARWFVEGKLAFRDTRSDCGRSFATVPAPILAALAR